MADLRTDLAGIMLQNPVVTASGTFGYAKEYKDLVALDRLGAVTVKGVSPFPSHGNPPPRTAEVFAGMLNAIGLQNPGIDMFLENPDYLPFLRSLETHVFVNIWGKTIADYVEVARRLEAEKDGISALEINISCPNIKEGGVAFGTDLRLTHKVVHAVRKVTSLPLITKLSPNVNDIGAFARAAVEAGSNIISLINTITGMAIDIETHRPRLANCTGGLSGPAVKPVAVRMVYQVRQVVDVPIIGMGGITTADDAVEFLIAGANAVGVGTATFGSPCCLLEIIEGINAYLDRHQHRSVSEIINTLKT